MTKLKRKFSSDTSQKKCHADRAMGKHWHIPETKIAEFANSLDLGEVAHNDGWIDGWMDGWMTRFYVHFNSIRVLSG